RVHLRCRPALARPRRDGPGRGAGPRVAALLARPHLDRRGRRGAARGPARGRGAGPAGGRAVRLLAAMSGGVDSAVAAALAVDAGHEVTGVHLALAEAPATLRTGSRGCCSREDARDAARAADVLGIPFYVWDLAAEFRASVVDDF